ncbi:hypothetical protein KFZ58_09815 [Virgibacillus sp. NKC19-16]|uniref:hypothetical protein n=1 Tax=Virgibacillus salidurans TaxID=2831673 RepID=UPI001F291AC7|nr:hypothetical protein [Virgibacillus sp. NKC19-16]UJL48115.1 hypothetical protein KFZ58_09815 [Virgibacillus sp. NKC19-16]
MNNKSSNQEDQAVTLMSLLDEVQQGDTQDKTQSTVIDETEAQEREVDVLNLPPRKEVHRKIKQRTHIKMGIPLLRFLIVFILLLGVLTGAYLLWGEELITVISNL